MVICTYHNRTGLCVPLYLVIYVHICTYDNLTGLCVHGTLSSGARTLQQAMERSPAESLQAKGFLVLCFHDKDLLQTFIFLFHFPSYSFFLLILQFYRYLTTDKNQRRYPCQRRGSSPPPPPPPLAPTPPTPTATSPTTSSSSSSSTSSKLSPCQPLSETSSSESRISTSPTKEESEQTVEVDEEEQQLPGLPYIPDPDYATPYIPTMSHIPAMPSPDYTREERKMAERDSWGGANRSSGQLNFGQEFLSDLFSQNTMGHKG